MNGDPPNSEPKYSPHGGVVIRGNPLAIFIWREEQGIEVLLSAEQAIGLGLSLFEAVRDALSCAKREAEATCKN